MKGKFGIAWGRLDRRWRREAVRFHFLGGVFSSFTGVSLLGLDGSLVLKRCYVFIVWFFSVGCLFMKWKVLHICPK